MPDMIIDYNMETSSEEEISNDRLTSRGLEIDV